MKKEDYFKEIISLFEAEIDPQQQQIADSGSDEMLDDTQPVEELPEEDAPMEEIPEGLDDANYLNIEEPSPSPEKINEAQRLKKVFTLLENLLNYGELFYDSLVNTDLDLLDDTKYESVSLYLQSVKDTTEKIREYLNNVFESDTYERCLYIYILLRTELLTEIKKLRQVLEVNSL